MRRRNDRSIDLVRRMVIDGAWRRINAYLNSKEVDEKDKNLIALEICKKTCPKDHFVNISRDVKYISNIPTAVVEQCKQIIEVKPINRITDGKKEIEENVTTGT